MLRTFAPLAACLATIACAQQPDEAEIANPAATFCIEQGGRHQIRETADGQTGVCILPDGREVDAWEYFRAENG